MTNDELSKYFSDLGKKGGKARAKKLTKEQIRRIGRKGGKAKGRSYKKLKRLKRSK